MRFSKFTRAASWINSKISNGDDNTTLMIFLMELLEVFNAVELHFLKSQVICSNTACSSSMRPFLVSNCNMTGNSVEKCFLVLNVKLDVNLGFKTFYKFKSCYILLSPGRPLPAQLVLLKIFAYPSNKHVIHEPELNV